MDHFELYGVYTAEHLVFNSREMALHAPELKAEGWPEMCAVVAEFRRERKSISGLQRGYWFGCLIPAIAAHTGDDEKSTHEDVKAELFPRLNLPRSITRRWKSKRTGRWRQRSKPLSIKDLNSKQMTDLIDMARKWAAEELPPLGLVIPEPDPSWRSRKAA